MSSNHKAPLAAFVVVALACVVVLATNSMRSYARDAWRQLAAPVVSGLTLVPSPGADSLTTSAVRDATADTATDTATDTHSAADATPAVAVTTAKPVTHHHRHHPAKTTSVSDTTPAAPAPQPVTPAAPAAPAAPGTQTWPSHGPSHSDHPSWSATHHPARSASTQPAADRGDRFGHSERPTGFQHSPGNRDWHGMTPGRGFHPAAKTAHAGDNGPRSPSRGPRSGHTQTSWGHGWSAGSHRR